ncbi:hypothetical protein D3C84_1243710 [compost metagenome]
MPLAAVSAAARPVISVMAWVCDVAAAPREERAWFISAEASRPRMNTDSGAIAN